MELTFQEEWNLKFGQVKPPEWVFKFTTQSSQNTTYTAEDVEKKIVECGTQVETLRSELNQQLFLLEWLQKKTTEASREDSHTQQQDEPSNHVQLEEESQSHCSDLLECQEHKDKSETLGDKEEPENANQDSDILPSQSEESFCSTTEVLEGNKPATVAAIKSASLEDLASEYFEEKEVTSSPEPFQETEIVRHRFVHCVNSRDILVAKTVQRRLLEQGRGFRSCELLDLKSKTFPHVSSLPAALGRAKSDPSLSRIEPQSLPTTTIVDREDTKALSESLYLTKTHRNASTNTEIEQPFKTAHNLSSTEETQENQTLNGDKIIQVSQVINQTADDSARTIEIVNGHIMSTGDVEKRRSQDDEDMRRWSLGKRASNGISYDTGFTVIESDDDSDPAVLNLFANRIRATLRSPRTSLDHLRDRDEPSLSNGSPKEVTTLREHHRGNLRASGGSISDESNLTVNNEGDYKPVFSKQTTLMDSSTSARISQSFSEDECITPRGGESDNSMTFSQDSLLEGKEEQVVSKPEEDPVMTLTRERMDTKLEREKVGRKEISDSAHESRMERLKQGIYSPYDHRHSMDDPTRTLTHRSTGKYSGYDSFEELEVLTPLGSLENAIRTTLDKIRSTPEMSMATLLDVEENKDLNARFHESSSEPSFSDSDLTESIEPDEATICAITLRSDMYSSRSNSASSLTGLFSGSDPNLSSSPPEMESPSHSAIAIQGVNLRHTSGSRRRDRNRMGNAELDMMTGTSDEGSDLSPCHTTSSHSRSPTSEDSNSVPVSPISPRGLTGSDSSVGTTEIIPSITVSC